MPGYWTEWGGRPVLHPQEVQRYSLPNLTEDNDNTLCQFERPRANKPKLLGFLIKNTPPGLTCHFKTKNNWHHVASEHGDSFTFSSRPLSILSRMYRKQRVCGYYADFVLVFPPVWSLSSRKCLRLNTFQLPTRKLLAFSFRGCQGESS